MLFDQFFLKLIGQFSEIRNWLINEFYHTKTAKKTKNLIKSCLCLELRFFKNIHLT